MRTPLREWGGLRRDEARSTANVKDEDSAFRPWQPARCIDEDADCRVGKLGKVVTLPAIAATRCQQRIKCLQC